MDEGECRPMWLLPVRADHVGSCAARENAEAERLRYRRCNDGQHLSLRHVSAYPRRDQAGGCRTGAEGMSAQMIQRRTFLAGLGGLVLVASVSRIAKAAD